MEETGFGSRDPHRPVYRGTVTKSPVRVRTSRVVALRRAAVRILLQVAQTVRRRVAEVMHQVAQAMEPTEVLQGEEDGLEMVPMRTLVGLSVQVDKAEEVLPLVQVRRHSWPKCSVTR